MTPPFKLSLEPTQDKRSLRRQLQVERQSLIDRHQRAVHLQEVLRVWLLARAETSIGAYWPIKGEFDALPALYRWSEADPGRRIGLTLSLQLARAMGGNITVSSRPGEGSRFTLTLPAAERLA